MHSDAKAPLKLISRLSIDTLLGSFLGDTRIRLLEAIAAHGSISQAAKAVPLSYKAAWDAIDAMNNLAEQPLVLSNTGGRQGGGTQLTPYGRRVIAIYRALEQEYQAATEYLSQALTTDDSDTNDVAQCRQLLRRMAIKTSARNQFTAQVVALYQTVVSTEVQLQLNTGQHLTALITRASAAHLELAPGMTVQILIKASSVILATDPAVHTSAHNQLWGTVKRIECDSVNAEVTLLLAGAGEHTVTALITNDSLAQLGVAVGMPAGALFTATSVLVVTGI